jgi:hypothetical protein
MEQNELGYIVTLQAAPNWVGEKTASAIITEYTTKMIVMLLQL